MCVCVHRLTMLISNVRCLLFVIAVCMNPNSISKMAMVKMLHVIPNLNFDVIFFSFYWRMWGTFKNTPKDRERVWGRNTLAKKNPYRRLKRHLAQVSFRGGFDSKHAINLKYVVQNETKNLYELKHIWLFYVFLT